MSHLARAALNLRVFVVEDHADTQQLLAAYLRRRGCEVAVASSMTEALAALPSFSCQVLLSDVGLPDGDGWELITRANLPPEVVAIAMSGFGTKEDLLKSDAVGFCAHLVKPFSMRKLDVLLEQAAQSQSGH